MTNASAYFPKPAARTLRNYLLNSAFDGWQYSSSQSSDGYGSDDRFLNKNLGSTKIHSQQIFSVGQTDVPGEPTFFSRTVVTSVLGASNYVFKAQAIESALTLHGQDAVIVLYAKADSARSVAVELVQDFGTGGSPSARVTGIGITQINLTTSWQRFDIPVTIPSISGKVLGSNNDDSLSVILWLDAGTAYDGRTNTLGQQSGTFEFAQMNLFGGTDPGIIEKTSVTDVFLQLQRYYYIGQLSFQGDVTNANSYGVPHTHPVLMRTVPTTTQVTTSTVGFNGATIASEFLTSRNLRLRCTCNATTVGGSWFADFTAQAELFPTLT